MRIGFYMEVFEGLGVEYLSACLRQAGHETLLFFDPKLGNDTVVLSKPLAYLLNMEDMIAEQMAEAELDVAAFSVMTDTYGNALRMAQKLKARCDVPTVFGGIHASSVPERVLAQPAVDYAVVGEGEHALLDLVEALESGETEAPISNVGRKSEGRIVIQPPRPLVEDLDTLPFPDTDLFWKRARGYRNSCYNIVASRGCPMACTYCCNPLMKKLYRGKGRWHRRWSVDNVIKEMIEAVGRHDFDRVNFWDDDFVDNAAWLEEFAGKYETAIGLPFFAWAHPRNVNPHAVALLEKAGCQELSLGVQSTNEQTRRTYLQRFENNEELKAAFAAVRDSNIFLSTQNILQLPGQTPEEAHDMVRFYAENPVELAHVQLLRYYPRTEVVRIAKELGMITDADIERFEEAEGPRLLSVAQPDDQPVFLKVRHFIVLMGLLPRFLIRFLLCNRRYMHLPTTRTSHVFILLTGMFQRLFSKKKRFVMSYTIPEYLMHYVRFASMKLAWTLRRPAVRRLDGTQHNSKGAAAR